MFQHLFVSFFRSRFISFVLHEILISHWVLLFGSVSNLVCCFWFSSKTVNETFAYQIFLDSKIGLCKIRSTVFHHEMANERISFSCYSIQCKTHLKFVLCLRSFWFVVWTISFKKIISFVGSVRTRLAQCFVWYIFLPVDIINCFTRRSLY